jgi:hypothetical protein
MLVVVLAAASLIVAVAPAGANNKPTTGPRIPFNNGPDTFSANSPFYIEQGNGCLLSDSACMTAYITGQSTFVLYLDGVRQPSTPDVDLDAANHIIRKFQLTNYPNGLPAGMHTFRGEWIVDGVVDDSQTTDMTINFTSASASSSSGVGSR